MENFLGLIITPHPPLILPEIGRGKEREAQRTIEGIQRIAKLVKESKPEVIICITPHGNVFQDGVCVLDEAKIAGDLRDFGHPRLRIKKDIDIEFNDKLIDEFAEHEIPSVFLNENIAKEYNARLALDHGCIVPLYYIDKLYKDYKIVHITIGLLSLHELYLIGKMLRRIIDKGDTRAMLLASADLSHCLKAEGPYPYNPSGEVFDKRLVEAISSGAFNEIINMPSELYESACECGLRPIAMGLGAFDGFKTKSTIYSYEGPYGVGYMNAYIEGLTEETDSNLDLYLKNRYEGYEGRKRNESIYVSLARAAVEECVKHGKHLDWEAFKNLVLTGDIVEELENTNGGVFVSIHKDNILRGCIGTIAPSRENLAEEIIYNAIEAATEDERFYPIRKSELADLVLKVDVMHELEAIRSLEELDVKKYGVVVMAGNKKGLLLPDIEGIDSVEKQISIAKKKAGIKRNTAVKLYRFAVTRYY